MASDHWYPVSLHLRKCNFEKRFFFPDYIFHFPSIVEEIRRLTTSASSWRCLCKTLKKKVPLWIKDLRCVNKTAWDLHWSKCQISRKWINSRRPSPVITKLLEGGISSVNESPDGAFNFYKSLYSGTQISLSTPAIGLSMLYMSTSLIIVEKLCQCRIQTKTKRTNVYCKYKSYVPNFQDEIPTITFFPPS